MRIIRTIRQMRKEIPALRNKGQTIGFVPTMGAFHEGHLSLARKCRRENDICVVSIFVNPAQFGPREDCKKYPRQEKQDIRLAKKENVDIIFYPSEKEMYPASFLTHSRKTSVSTFGLTRVHIARLSNKLCGEFRPGHFDGVTTVVAKLLNIVRPDVLYLGQKDAQQAVILRQMIADLNFPVRVKICATVREPGGLAMSSRNAFLTPQQRKEAAVLYASLKEARQKIRAGEQNPGKLLRQIKQRIIRRSSAQIDYAACVDADSLDPIKDIRSHKRILFALAVRLGGTRLIDNIVVSGK